MCAKLLQSCPTLCHRMDCSLPASSVHGILQEKLLEWVAMLSSRGSSQPRDRTCISYVSYICRQEGNGNPLQYSCLENPMDGGAWLATVHGVTESRTRLSNFTITIFTASATWEALFSLIHLPKCRNCV